MKLPAHPFEKIDWANIERIEHAGSTGKAFWRTKWLGDIRVRMVEYTENYTADHWCSKGHIIYVIKGEMITELQDGRVIELTEGMTYFAGDNDIPHRSGTTKGVELLIID